jgi:hypothetical protein
MNTKLLAMIGLCASMAFASCKKDDDKKEPETFSIVGTWKMSAFTLTMHMGGGKDTILQEYDDMDPCEKDDLERYNADKTVNYLDGPIKCNPNDTETVSATWLITDNNTKLTLRFQNGDDVYNIATLNATTLKLYAEDPDMRIDMTYTRQ